MGQVRTATETPYVMLMKLGSRPSHAQMKDINVVELGVLTSSTSRGSDICVVEQVSYRTFLL